MNDFLNDSAKAGLDKSSRRLESVKTILEKSKILQPQVVRATTYAENLDLVTEMQGIIFSNSKDVVYIERASFMYKTFLSRSLSKELSSLLHRLLDFLKSLTLNCVDLKRLSSAIEVPTADVELDFKDNIVVDLTTRYGTYKKLLFKSSGEEKGLQINTNQGDENVSIASSYLYKLQDDKFFSLVCKYVRICSYPRDL